MTLKEKMAEIEVLPGFFSYDFYIITAKRNGTRIAIVEYWLTVKSQDLSSNVKIFVVKDFGLLIETARETKIMPSSLSATRSLS